MPQDIREGVSGKSGVEDIPSEEKLGVVSCLLTNNIKYTVGDNFIIDIVEEDIPILIKIDKIVQFRGVWMIIGKLLIPKAIDSHYHAFKLEDQRKWVVVQPGEEKDYHPLDTYVHDDDTFITLYHSVQSSR